MDTKSIAAGSTPASTGVGAIIFSTEPLPSSKPITTIIADSPSPARYSARPCPNGCSGSGFFPAMAKPSSVITDEPASERLLKASAVMATEPEMLPAKYFPAKSSTLMNMPYTLHSAP